MPMYIPTDSVPGLPFLHILASIFICDLFDDSHSYRCDMVSHCDFFICLSLMICDVEHLSFLCTSLKQPPEF